MNKDKTLTFSVGKGRDKTNKTEFCEKETKPHTTVARVAHLIKYNKEIFLLKL